MRNWTRESDEVFYADGSIVYVGADDVDFLKYQASENPRGCARLCAHPDAGDALHEMLIVLVKGFCVLPHKHKGKSESFHLVEGEMTVVIFEDDGNIKETIPMAALGNGETFYYRLSEESYHTVIPKTDFVVFHETTNGPFRREDMQFAPWAPGANAPEDELQDFVQELIRRIS